MPVAPVAIPSPSRLSLSPVCPLSMSTFSFPSPGGPGPTSLRALSLDSFCRSDIDERTVPAAGGGGGGGDGGVETGQFVFSRRVGDLGCRPLSAVNSASEGLKGRT